MTRVPRLLSDERLATMAGGGSDPAFAMLYRRYDGPLHGYCLSIVKNAEDARDVLQSAWMKALVALRAGSRRAPVRPWLFRIVHNEAIDVIRRRRGEEPLLDSHHPPGRAAGADEEAVDRERVAEVVADLRALPEGQRSALVMREWADLEYEEIALALATSEGNARQLVFSARSGLAESRAGRNQSCDAIRLELAGADGRRLRNRRIRTHLDNCRACREFSAETRDRRRAAAAALLPWAPVAAPELLSGLVGGGATAGGVAGGSALLGGLAKGAAVAAIVTGGVGGAELAVEETLRPDRTEAVEVARAPEAAVKGAASPAVARAGRPASASGSASASRPGGVRLSVRKDTDSSATDSEAEAEPRTRERRDDPRRSGEGRPRRDRDGAARRVSGDGYARDGYGGDGPGPSGDTRRDRSGPGDGDAVTSRSDGSDGAYGGGDSFDESSRDGGSRPRLDGP
ncbi:MAG TPA: sigma-70 family RNA polymerase sigma factor [Thermoleophilaceae bacterium]